MSDNGLTRAASISEIVSAVGLIVGLALAAIGVYTEREIRTERYTFEYVDRYFDEDMREQRNLIRETLSEIEAVEGVNELSNYEISLLFAERVSEAEEGELRFALVSLLDFFSGAETCVEAKLCNLELIRTMVGSEARSLACLVSPAAARITLSGGQDSLLSGLRFIADDNPCA